MGKDIKELAKKTAEGLSKDEILELIEELDNIAFTPDQE